MPQQVTFPDQHEITPAQMKQLDPASQSILNFPQSTFDSQKFYEDLDYQADHDWGAPTPHSGQVDFSGGSAAEDLMMHQY